MSTFYDRFTQLAMQNGYSSPTALGEELGFSSSLVSTWKVRKAKPRMNTIVSIAEKFGVSPDWLAGEAVDMEGNPLPFPPQESVKVEAPQREMKLFVPRLGYSDAKEVATYYNANARKVIDGTLALLLFGDDASLVTPEDLDEIRDYAQVVLNRRKRKG